MHPCSVKSQDTVPAVTVRGRGVSTGGARKWACSIVFLHMGAKLACCIRGTRRNVGANIVRAILMEAQKPMESLKGCLESQRNMCSGREAQV